MGSMFREWQVNDRVKRRRDVFDPDSRFMYGDVVEVYAQDDGGETLYAVQWDHREHVARGYFAHGLEAVGPEHAHPRRHDNPPSHDQIGAAIAHEHVNVDQLVRDAADQVLAEFTEIGGGYNVDHAKAIALNRLKDAIKAAKQEYPEHGTPPGVRGGQA